MKPAPFAYLRPGSLADALAALAEAPDAKVLAGGQSLVPLLSMRLAAPGTLVDINGLPGLADVTVTDDGVRIGALARHADVLASADVRRVQPLVTMALANVAHADHPQPRHHRRLARARRRRRRDAGRAAAARAVRSRSSPRPGGAARSPPTTCSSGRSSRRWSTTRSRSRRSSRRCRPAPAWPSTRSPAGTATTPCAASPRWSTATDACAPGTSRSATCPPSSTSPACPRSGGATWPLEQLDPADDIHATADYRAQLARVLTARVVRAAYSHAEGSAMTEELHPVRLTVNGTTHDVAVPARRLLSDALRHDLGLTGTHVGCEHGVCGACTVLVDGRPVRSCLMFAVSAVDAEITTVEGLTNPDGSLGPVQQAFKECHGLQCGFCTPGFLTTITAGLRDNPHPTRDEAREMIARQPVPLHRLPEHRQGRRARGRAHRRPPRRSRHDRQADGHQGPARRGRALPARPRPVRRRRRPRLPARGGAPLAARPRPDHRHRRRRRARPRRRPRRVDPRRPDRLRWPSRCRC